MSSQIDKARQAGYTDDEISDFLSKKNPKVASQFSDARKSGYSTAEILDHLHEKSLPSQTRSKLSAYPKGLIEGVQDLNPLGVRGPISKGAAKQILEKFLPTRDDPLERGLEIAGKLTPAVAVGPEGVIPKAAQLAGGTLGGLAAKEAGFGDLGQTGAEIIGMGLPGLVKAGAKKLIQSATAPVEKMISGLTKPRAVGAKAAEKGIITPERQEKVLNKLNEEASKLTKESVSKQLPLSKKIAEGHDFEREFEHGFGSLQKAAEKANPDIETAPLSQFLADTTDKYHGIPKLHPEAQKIRQEINAYRNQPQTQLKNLLRIYRSNNKKIRNIYETSRLTGKQQEYVDFLVDYNKNIAKSFENTLPADSAWVKQFKDLNADYKQYRDSLKTLNALEPILNQRATPATLQKFASDKRLQDKLSLSMGKEGANQIIQIAKDLKEAQDSIKKIPARELKIWDAVFPLGIFVPFVKIPAGVAALKKGYDWARRGYGFFLTSPAKRKSYDKAAKAIVENDIKAYKQATDELKKEIGKSEIKMIEFKSPQSK